MRMVLMFAKEQDDSGLILLCASEHCVIEEIKDKEIAYVGRYGELYHDDECKYTGLEKLSEDDAVKKPDIMKELYWISIKKARKLVREGRIVRRCYTFSETGPISNGN